MIVTNHGSVAVGFRQSSPTQPQEIRLRPERFPRFLVPSYDARLDLKSSDVARSAALHSEVQRRDVRGEVWRLVHGLAGPGGAPWRGARHRLPRSGRDQPGGRPRRRQGHHACNGGGGLEGKLRPGPACHRRGDRRDRGPRAVARDQSGDREAHQRARRAGEGLCRHGYIHLSQTPARCARRREAGRRFSRRSHRREHRAAHRMH